MVYRNLDYDEEIVVVVLAAGVIYHGSRAVQQRHLCETM